MTKKCLFDLMYLSQHGSHIHTLSRLTLRMSAHLCLVCEAVKLLKNPFDGVGIVAALVIDVEALEAETFK